MGNTLSQFGGKESQRERTATRGVFHWSRQRRRSEDREIRGNRVSRSRAMNLRAKARPRDLATNSGCRGHPCPRRCGTHGGFRIQQSDLPFGPDIERAECYDLRGIAMAGTKITLEQVRHVARLARLEWSPEEEERLRADMDEMLAYVDKLNELDTKEVAPTTQVGEAGMPMRDDEVTNRPAAEAMLANAPSRERGYFKVPKIIE